MVARPRHATEVVHVFILKAVSVHSSVIGQMNSYSVCTSSVSLIMVAYDPDLLELRRNRAREHNGRAAQWNIVISWQQEQKLPLFFLLTTRSVAL